MTVRRRGPWPVVCAALGLLFFAPGGYWSATWLGKWFFIEATWLGAFCLWAARRTSYWYLPALVYVTGGLLILAAWPQAAYQADVAPATLLALQKNAFAGLLEVLTLVGVFALGRHVRGYGAALVTVWLLGVLGFLILPLSGPRSAPNNGICFGNPSMGAGLLSCLLPEAMSVTRNRYAHGVMWLSTFIAVIKTGASVPWGVLGVATAAVFIAWKRFTPRVLIGLAALAVLMITLGRALLGAAFWDQNGRFEIWRMAWDWYRVHGSLAWGMGYSTSQILVPLEQVITGHYHGDFFLWLHNDLLQILIEGGGVGSSCVVLSLGRLAWLTRNRPALAGSLAGFVTLAAFNYPLRMPIHALCLALLCGIIESTAPHESPAPILGPASGTDD